MERRRQGESPRARARRPRARDLRLRRLRRAARAPGRLRRGRRHQVRAGRDRRTGGPARHDPGAGAAVSWLAAPMAVVAAAFPPGAANGSDAGWRPPTVQHARPLLDAPAAVRPALAAGPTGVTALAFLAETTRGPRMAVARRAPGPRSFLTPRTLAGRPDLNDAGGRAPALAAGPRGAFAAAWLAWGRGARRTPGVVVSIRRPGHLFGTPHQVSRRGARPLAAPPAVALDSR